MASPQVKKLTNEVLMYGDQPPALGSNSLSTFNLLSDCGLILHFFSWRLFGEGCRFEDRHE